MPTIEELERQIGEVRIMAEDALDKFPLRSTTTPGAVRERHIHDLGKHPGGVIAARVHNSAAITHTSGNPGAFQTLTFDSERFDTDDIHSTSSNTGRLTAKTAGKYLISGHITWAGNNTGRRILSILLNGATRLADTTLETESTPVLNQSVATIYELSVDDYVELQAFQSSNGNLVIQANSNYSPEFTMARVGAAGTSGGGTPGTDHGSLTGLSDDDHSQYILASGTRALTADWPAGNFDIEALTLTTDKINELGDTTRIDFTDATDVPLFTAGGVIDRGLFAGHFKVEATAQSAGTHSTLFVLSSGNRTSEDEKGFHVKSTITFTSTPTNYVLSQIEGDIVTTGLTLTSFTAQQILGTVKGGTFTDLDVLKLTWGTKPSDAVTVTNWRVLEIERPTPKSGDTVTNQFGAHIRDQGPAGITVTTVKALAIDDITTGTNRYPIFQEGTSGFNILAADTRIGVNADPSAPLDVQETADGDVVGPATDIAFVDGGGGADTITQVAAGFGVFAAGELISISGSSSNDGQFTIVSVIAGTITLATGTLTTESAGASVTVAEVVSNQVGIFRGGNRATAIDNDEAFVSFTLDDDVGTQKEFARLTWIARDVTAASPDAALKLEMLVAGTLRQVMLADDTATNNMFFGPRAGEATTTATNCAFFGTNAGLNNSSGANNMFLGALAGTNSTTASNNVFIGGSAGKANTTAGNNVYIGTNAGLVGQVNNQNVFIGVDAGRTAGTLSGQGDLSVIIGASAGATLRRGRFHVLIGKEADITDRDTSTQIAIGYRALTNAAKQMVIGGRDTNGTINDLYIGNGVSIANPSDITVNATGGSGTDNAGAAFIIGGGKPTGAGTGGSIILKTAPAGSTGTALQALVTRLTIDETGNAILNGRDINRYAYSVA